MSIEKILKLLEIMEAHELTELELEDGDFRVKLGKGHPGAPHLHPALPASAPAASNAPVPTANTIQDEGLETITSPIVGTFYRAPSPESDPFVTVGDSVNEKTVVCIVEAMKVMNEINAGVNGKIAKILVENGEAVEYGQPLFLVNPA
ncbi:MAG: acetyl-CoA carboxylase biotin carboxyl carrier protein [Planctomycetes bacterium]|nr:acetyl-CoA carboxylase biotin carboxyl carrier protein [Planctomycetota bacterium]